MRLLVTGAAGMLGQRRRRAAARGRARVVGLDTRRARHHRRRPRSERVVADAARRRRQLRRVDRRRRRRGARGRRARRQRRRRRPTSRAAARDAGALLVHVSTDYVFDGAHAARPTSSPTPTGAALAPTGAPSSPASTRSPAAGGRPRDRAHRVAVRRAAARTSSPRCCALGAERDEVAVVDDQVGSPDLDRPSRARAGRAGRAARTGVVHVAGGGACSWYELAGEAFQQAGVDCRVQPHTTAESPRPAPRPGLQRAGQRARRRPAPARLARRARRLPGRAGAGR